MNNPNLKEKFQCYYEKLLLSKTVQLVTFIVKDYVTCEFTWNDLWTSMQRVPAARFQGSDCESACWKITWRKRNYETKSSMATFLKLFDIHATYCYLQVDLKSFVASRAFFLSREATERATISQAINSRHSWLFDCNSTETRNQHQQVALLAHLDNIFSLPRPRLAPLDLVYSLYSSSR